MDRKPPRSTLAPTDRLARNLSPIGEFVCRPIGRPNKASSPVRPRHCARCCWPSRRRAIGGVRLAGQLQKMRAAKSLDPVLRRKLANRDPRSLRAPSQSIGVWQLKWELEDLAFRYLQPADYKRIAAALNARRSERERYMEELKMLLRSGLHTAASKRRSRDDRNTSIAFGARCRRSSSPSSSSWTFAPLVSSEHGSRMLCGARGGALAVAVSLPGSSTTTLQPRRTTDTVRFTPPSSGPARKRSRYRFARHEMHANSERGVAAHWRYKEGAQLLSLRAQDQSAPLTVGTDRRRRYVARFSRPHAGRSIPGSYLCDIAQG